MKVLETKEIILRGPKVGRSYAFMLNPEFGWKGKVKNLDEYRKQRSDDSLRKSQRKEQKPSDDLINSEKLNKVLAALKSGQIDIDSLYELVPE
jgi:hypothetical protein